MNEEAAEKKTEEFGNRVKNWFKERDNQILFGIIVLALIVRLYFFFVTKNQPLWWDEAEYALRAKAFAFGTPITGWASEREILIPWLFSLVFRIGFGEITIRLIQVIVSIGTVAMSYFTFSKYTNKKAAFAAALGVAFLWVQIFFTERILLYLWAPFIYLAILYFFYKGYMEGNKKYLIAFAIASAIGIYVYFSIGFLLLGIFIYLVLTEGTALIKNKKAWLALAVFVIFLIPYMAYYQINNGTPFPRYAVGLKAAAHEAGAGFSAALSYVNMFPSRVGWVFTALVLIGVIYFIYQMVLGIGIKGYLKNHSKELMLFLAFFVPLLLYTIYGVVGGSGTFYDAFVLPVFVMSFAFAGIALEKIYIFLKKYNKTVAIIIITALLLLHVYYGYNDAGNSIKGKLQSYDSLKYAGLWIKQNSNTSDIVFNAGVPQNTYYSERTTYGYPSTEAEFLEKINVLKPKYMVLSVWETAPQWAYPWPGNNTDKVEVVQAYFSDAAKTQVTAIVYEFK